MRKMLSETILDLGKGPNQKMHESEKACFLVGALRKVQNQIWKQLLYNYYYKKIGAFWLIFNKVKKWISHGILKSCMEGFGFFFFKLGSLFFCQMACIYLLNSHVGPRCLNFVITTYSYPLLFENTIGNPFFDFFKYWLKRSNKS